MSGFFRLAYLTQYKHWMKVASFFWSLTTEASLKMVQYIFGKRAISANPKEVLSKNLQTPISAFENLPSDQLYIVPGTPAPADISNSSTVNITGSPGEFPINKS